MSAADPVFRARRLGHVNLFVDDLDRSTRFYNSVCGLALEFRELGLRASFLGTGNTPHDVGMIETTKGRDRYGRDGHLQLPKEAGANVGLNHIAWEMENEVELVEGYRRAQARHVPILRLADHQIAHSIYLKDPDGNVVEFYVDTVREWRKVLHGDLDLITSVWNPDAREPFADVRHDPDPTLRRVPGTPFRPRRLTHVVLLTHDVPRLRAFYEDVAGLGTIHRLPDSEAVLMRGQHTAVPYHLAIVKAADGASGLHHFALELDEAPALPCSNVFVEHRVDTAAKSSIFLKDPDGFRIELFAAKDGRRAPEFEARALVELLGEIPAGLE
jgi:catechol 2,3-dioxygenase